MAWDRRVLTLNYIHLTLQHYPFSSTNATCIQRHCHYPLYIILALVGVLTNNIVNISVNTIAETLHGKNREGLF